MFTATWDFLISCSYSVVFQALEYCGNLNIWLRKYCYKDWLLLSKMIVRDYIINYI